MPEFNAPKRRAGNIKNQAPQPVRQPRPDRGTSPVPPTRKKKYRKKDKIRKKRSRKSFIVYYVAFFILAVIIVTVLSVTVLFNVGGFTVETLGAEDITAADNASADNAAADNTAEPVETHEQTPKQSNSVYSDEEIIAASGIALGTNLTRLDTAAAEKSILEKLIYLEDVTVEKAFPDGVKITVKMAEEKTSVYFGGNYYLISGKGRILSVGKTLKTEQYVTGYDMLTVAPGEYLSCEDEEKTQIIFDIVECLERLEFNEIGSIDIADRFDIVLHCGNAVELRLGNSASLSEKLTVGQVIAREKIAPNEEVSILLNDPQRVVLRPLTSDNNRNIAEFSEFAAAEETSVSGDGSENDPENEETTE